MERTRKRWMVAAALAGVALAAGAQFVNGQTQQGKNQCWHTATESKYACSICGDGCMGTGFRCCTVIADPVPDAIQP